MFFATTALAQAASGTPLPQPTHGDWAVAWIDYIFRGTDLPAAMANYGAQMAPMAKGLRHALGFYSMAMVVLAAILLFYHVASAIVDTAHSGVVLGRRANQTWAPIRLVVAIALLVPIGSGLSSGQYIVIKIAEEGSTLASSAWRAVTEAMGGNFSNLVTPAPPNIAALAATATEMEICRLIYQQAYATPAQNSPLALAGPMGDLIRTPGGRIADESWIYTNTLNAGTPLCGAYRFPGYRRRTGGGDNTNISRMAEDLSAFAHTEAENIAGTARLIAVRAVPVFYQPQPPAGFSVRSDISAVEKSLHTDITAHLQKLDSVSAAMSDGILTAPAEAGWIAAIVFIPEFIRLQESYGELVSHMLPETSGPVFAHPALAQKTMVDALAARGAYSLLDRNTTAALAQFYGQVSAPVAAAHGWIYGSELGENDYVPPGGLDVYDQLNAATDAEAAFGLFGRALDTAAIANGVWGADDRQVDSGNPFAAPPQGMAYNPLTTLIEYGRRQYALGLYLLGIAGGASSVLMAAAPAVLAGIVGLAFIIGGLGLVFLVPLVPFLRFLFAILVWLLDLFEAVAAMPIVAIAHLTPVGEGLSGGAARQAYVLWIGLLVRPILSLFGLVVGFLIFTIGAGFVALILGPFAHLAASGNTGILVVAATGLVLLYDALAYMVANAAFKGIYLLPDQALRWITPFVVAERSEASQSPPGVSTNISTTPIFTHIGGSARQERITPTAAFSIQPPHGQSALFPFSAIEQPASMSEASATGAVSHATGNDPAPEKDVSYSAITAPPGGAAKKDAPPRANVKTSPYTNIPFFQDKDKPKG